MEVQKYSCTRELGAELLIMIISLIIAYFSLTVCCSRNLSIFLSTSYALVLPLLSYMFAQAKQFYPEGRAQVILVWMVLIEIVRVRNDNSSTWELKNTAEQLVRLFWIGYLVSGYSPISGIRVTLFILCVLFAGLEVVKIIAHMKAKKSYLIGKNPKLIQNHVKRIMLQDNLRTMPLNSCDYIVMGEENHQIAVCNSGYVLGEEKKPDLKMLTIGRVFQLNSSEDKLFTLKHPNWRDSCLSFSLAKMLRRRFAKLPLDEAGSKKAREFVFEGLIDYIGTNKYIQTYGCTEKINPIEKLFSIIENELRYVHEFLHTRVPRSYYSLRLRLMDVICLSTVFATGIYLSCIVCISASSTYSHVEQDAYSDCFLHIFGEGSKVVKVFTGLDKGITILLVVACVYVQYNGSADSWWTILDSVNYYFENPVKWNNSHEKLNRQLSNRENNVNETGVDSMVSYEDKNWSIFGRSLHEPCCAGPQQCLKKNLAVRRAYVFRSTHAKETILKSLRDCGGRLTKGETSLKKHGMENLSWANYPHNESLTEAILVWHIATTLFHHQKPPLAQNNHPRHESQSQQNNDSSPEPPHQRNNDPFNKEREVASVLSNYCHYLVKSLPELLQEEVEWIEEKYDDLIADILAVDDQENTVEDRCDYALQATWDETTVVGKGVSLAKDLAGRADNGAPVWTMLADFWAELMLFISASDDVEAHEKIVEQRELITQLWALLTHAGILSRPKITPNLPSPWNKMTDDATGKIYFWNPETEVIQEERPIATRTPAPPTAPTVNSLIAPPIAADADAPTSILISPEAFSLQHEVTVHSVDHQSESDDITGDMNV